MQNRSWLLTIESFEYHILSIETIEIMISIIIFLPVAKLTHKIGFMVYIAKPKITRTDHSGGVACPVPPCYGADVSTIEGRDGIKFRFKIDLKNLTFTSTYKSCI